MIALCDAIHAALTVVFDMLWRALSAFGDYAQLIIVSAVFGFIMALHGYRYRVIAGRLPVMQVLIPLLILSALPALQCY